MSFHLKATQPLPHISANLADERLRRLDSDPQLRSLMDERAQLPVNPYRASILEAVRRNKVTIIRGETGCGKTTQVCLILCKFVACLQYICGKREHICSFYLYVYL